MVRRSVGFKWSGRADASAARFARCLCGLEITDISSSGEKVTCRERRMSAILFGTTTTRFSGVSSGIVGETNVGESMTELVCDP